MLDEEARGLDLGGAPRRRGGGGRRGAIYHFSIRTASRTKDNSARASAAYIQRAAEYGREAQEDELVHAESGHMPVWAAADATVYWEAADQHERANGRLFKRLEFALPLALSAADRAELAVGFAHSLTDAERLPYTLALHAGDGENPHCHLMISERGNDGVERSPAQWFKRYNAAEPEEGGARKSEALKPRAWFDETRAAWADQTNAALERAGVDVRIDHRSLADQGIEDRLPGVHLGPNVVEMEARGIETDKGNAARETARANAELAAAARQRAAAREERAAVLAALERRKAVDAERAAVQSHQEDVTYERTKPERERESGRAGVEGAGRDVGEEARGLEDSDLRDAAGRAGAGRGAGRSTGGGAGPEVGGGAGEADAAIADDARQRGRAPGEPGRGVGEGDPQPPRPDQLAGGTAQGVDVGPEPVTVEGPGGDGGGERGGGAGRGVALSGVRPAGEGAGAAGDGAGGVRPGEREVAGAVGEYVRGGEGGDPETRRRAAAVELEAEELRAELAATRAARQAAREQLEATREARQQEEREREQAREQERKQEQERQRERARGEDFDLEP
jgi:hypothetical protein